HGLQGDRAGAAHSRGDREVPHQPRPGGVGAAVGTEQGATGVAMAERDLFEHRRPLAGSGSLSCEDWELLLTESLDGLLPAAQRTDFDAHAAGCSVCAELLEQARQGQEWLRFLGPEPEVPAGMVERIVGKTSGAIVAGRPLAAGV